MVLTACASARLRRGYEGTYAEAGGVLGPGEPIGVLPKDRLRGELATRGEAAAVLAVREPGDPHAAGALQLRVPPPTRRHPAPVRVEDVLAPPPPLTWSAGRDPSL